MSADPYRYFRIEARELVEGLTRGVLDLEKGAADTDLVSRLLRYAHTLKGAARIVKQPKISELSHSIEEVLAALREQPGSVPADRIRQLLNALDEISSGLAALGSPEALASSPKAAEDRSADEKAKEPPPAEAPSGGARAGDEQLETIRVERKDLDALLRTVSELRVQLTGMSRLMLDLEQAARLASDLALEQPARHAPVTNTSNAPRLQEELEATLKNLHRTGSAVLERSDRAMESLLEQAEAMRLIPASSIFGVLERTVRDAAEGTGKQVAFAVAGGETRLDARGLGLLRNALIHLVRNAVTHGVEAPAARQQAGKPATASVQVQVERRGDRALFRCLDDGSGVNVERLSEVLLARKLVSASETARLTPQAAMDLLLRGGITTSRTISELSGRGVGLDVVRDVVATLKGSVAGVTEPGRGTRIEISVPVLVESEEVLHMQAGDHVVSIPLHSVTQTLRLTSEEIAVSPEGQSIVWQGRAIRFAPLTTLLKIQPPAGNGSTSAVIITSPTGTAALGVDHIVRRERVVIRAMPRILGSIPAISGAFLDSEGNPQLVLNPDGAIKAILAARWIAPEGPGVKPALPLLVIDDSLTTRMLEQGILETAGYAVDTASSGEEALDKARQRPYGLFIVDVEMPGMDGYEFIKTANGVPELNAIPSILVTSRSSPEDRARGLSVGAKAFIVKSKFDDKLLLKVIRELLA